MEKVSADIGVFGGSGFYSFAESEGKVREVEVDTPYGKPSDKIAIAEIGGRKVAFLPRHGRHHDYPPHMINFRANLWAFKELGVTRVIGPAAAGSLDADIKPGEFVVCDQFVDRTWGRKDTFYDSKPVTHVSSAEPYCPQLRKLAVDAAKKCGIPVHNHGTVVVIQGPRFSTKAESRWFSRNGWQVINMTQYPEAVLARELEMCYVNVSLITDYDAGLEGHVAPVTAEEVVKTFNANNDKLKKMLLELIPKIPEKRGECGCGTALKFARM
ncbi:MAG: S-methyl-5'-thioadenosine phosphorylase [Candidatus Micrarchaeia archaeon]|jgi:5'-methylthioadenosine phosphorylase